MTATTLLRQGLGAMRQYKLRSFFTMLGTFVGVAALAFVTSAGSAVEQKLLTTVRQLFSAESIFVTSGGGFFMAGPRSGDGARLTLDDLEAIAAEVPAVEAWDPVEMRPATARRGSATTTLRVMGQSAEGGRVWGRPLVGGEWFTQAQVDRAARVGLIGPTAAEALFGSEDPLGAEVSVNGVGIEIVGVLVAMGTDIHGLDRDNELVVPISTAMHRLFHTDTIRGARILVRDATLANETVPRVSAILRERHRLRPGTPDDFTLVNPVEIQRLVAKTRRILLVFLPLGAVVVLIAGSALGAALALSSVTARRQEIGLRRALGARSRDIAGQILGETIIATLAGGIAGGGIGLGGAALVAAHLDVASSPSLTAALLGVGLSLVTSVLASVLPARRAAGLVPAQALR